MPPTPDTRSRAWCITWNNPTDANYRVMDTVTCEYMIYQTERGDNGTKHIQGYVYFKNAKKFSRMQKIFVGAHLEVARGTPNMNKTYCSKIDSRIIGPHKERGTLPHQGNQLSDWDWEGWMAGPRSFRTY